jgi:hypothetical protein
MVALNAVELATPGDLETYLGVPVDEDRAVQLIELAFGLVQQMVDPVPDAAATVVLSAVARAYSNPTGVTTEMVGPYQSTRPSAGIYLTKSERATLRRMAGRSGAFSIDLLSGYADRFDD